MELKIIEAGHGPGRGNYGKFGVGLYTDAEWTEPGLYPGNESSQLLRSLGWTAEHVWLFDLQTGEGAKFVLGGFARADLNKKQIWVCPLFEPFLGWLYQFYRDHPYDWWERLPRTIDFPAAPFAMYGYRRPGDITRMTDLQRRRIGQLVHAALDHLWFDSPDSNPNDLRLAGCCPICCEQCNVIGDLLVNGDLETWLLGWSTDLDSTSWWDSGKKRVNRHWLMRAWARAPMLNCHPTGEPAVPIADDEELPAFL